jgi:hypothetical protein
VHLQEDWFQLNQIVLQLVTSVPHKTIIIPLEEVALRAIAILETSTQQLQAEEM